MRVVVDTNVLVSGLLSPFGPPAEIVRMVMVGHLQLCFDARIVTEYEDVLARPKFRFERTMVDVVLDQIRAEGVGVAGLPLPVGLPDPADDAFLEVAIAAKAQSLITGNLKHFPAGRRHGMHVVAPREFVRSLRGQR